MRKPNQSGVDVWKYIQLAGSLQYFIISVRTQNCFVDDQIGCSSSRWVDKRYWYETIYNYIVSCLPSTPWDRARPIIKSVWWRRERSVAGLEGVGVRWDVHLTILDLPVCCLCLPATVISDETVFHFNENVCHLNLSLFIHQLSQYNLIIVKKMKCQKEMLRTMFLVFFVIRSRNCKTTCIGFRIPKMYHFMENIKLYIRQLSS